MLVKKRNELLIYFSKDNNQFTILHKLISKAMLKPSSTLIETEDFKKLLIETKSFKDLLFSFSSFDEGEIALIERILEIENKESGEKLISQKNDNGDSILHYMISRNIRFESIEYFVKQYESIVRLTDVNGNTALHLAALNNDLKLAKVLIDNNPYIDILAKNKEGQVPAT